MNIGDKVKIIYDARPICECKEYPATVVRITPTGLLRIKTDEKKAGGKPVYSELFMARFPFFARGWNTLRWEPLE
jgi:hypothetical protein